MTRLRQSSASSFAARLVEPTRSQNITVIGRRSADVSKTLGRRGLGRGGRRVRRRRWARQGGDRVEQPAPIAERGDADVLEVVRPSAAAARPRRSCCPGNSPRIGRVRGFVAKTQRPWSYTRPRNDDRRDWEGCPARFALPLHPLRVVSRQFLVCWSGGTSTQTCAGPLSIWRGACRGGSRPLQLIEQLDDGGSIN